MLIMQNLSRKSSNASIGNMNKKLVFSVSILIPVAGLKTIKETIESVMHQKFRRWEILILRNSIQDLPQDTNIIEKDVVYQDHLIREIYIRKKGKGNALNVGICYARNALVCVIDADCILQEDALSKVIKHFQNDEVVAVGGRLLVKRDDSSQLEAIQFCEYMKAFQLSRRIFARLNAQCLISGAFGVFRKSTLLGMNGYDIDTVGEDMELVLRLQKQGFQQSKKQIVYEPTAICYTGVPHSIKRLLHQRDRWQRGLMDCLIKHHNLIANPRYELLGLVTMCYQLMVELLGPIFWVIYTVLLIEKNMLSFLTVVFVGYVLLQIGLAILAAYIDTEKNMGSLLRWIPKLILTTIEEMVLQIPIMVARIVGMLTFHWRRLVW